MEIVIKSDMSMAGTEMTVDGKKVKNINSLDFAVYMSSGPCEVGMPCEEVPIVRVGYTTEEEQEDGTMKRVNYSLYRKGTDDVVADSVVVNPSAEQIADELAKKCLGRKSIL